MKPKEESITPATFRIPRSGERDPHFGLTRSWYYAKEAEGMLRLIRIRGRGRQRGVTLVSYDDVLNLISNNAVFSDAENSGQHTISEESESPTAVPCAQRLRSQSVARPSTSNCQAIFRESTEHGRPKKKK